MKRFPVRFAACIAALCLATQTASAVPVDPHGLIRPDLLGRALSSLKVLV